MNRPPPFFLQQEKEMVKGTFDGTALFSPEFGKSTPGIRNNYKEENSGFSLLGSQGETCPDLERISTKAPRCPAP